MKKRELLIISIMILLGFLYYNQMPEMVASHWNIRGEVDGYMSRFWGLSIAPITAIIILLVFKIAFLIDPKRDKIKEFQKEIDSFKVTTLLFILYLQIMTIAWNLGRNFSVPQLLAPALGLFFFLSGRLIEASKENWSIGIKNSWTLSSSNVWNKTHKLGGLLFKATGVVIFFGVIFPQQLSLLVALSVTFSLLCVTIYSYLEYRRETRA